MSNFFTDNQDLTFIFEQMDLNSVVELMEHHYHSDDPDHPVHSSYEEAVEYFQASLELLGRICGEDIAPLRQSIDEEGSTLENGVVAYASGSEKARQLLSESGFMGAILPREHGGAHVPASIYMLMIEMVSRADASLMTMFGYQDVGELIARFGDKAQGERFLPKLCSGEHIGAIVLSEPGAGSDLQSIKVKAHQDESGQWRLNGTKHFISNGCGDVLMVLARSEPNVNNIFGLSLFACPKSDAVKVVRVEEKMGLHGSPTCELQFEDAPVELIGKRKFGLTKYILESLTQARFSVAAQSLGIAQEAFEMAKFYAHQRKQFNKTIIDIPAVADMLMQMQVALESSRTLLYFGAYWLDVKTHTENYIAQNDLEKEELKAYKMKLREAQQKVNLLSPMVKYYVTEAASKVCTDAQQVFGGMGYMKETGVEQLVRDIRITTIYEGTTQVQVAASLKATIADNLKADIDSKFESIDTSDEHISSLLKKLSQIREIYLGAAETLKASKDDTYKGACARPFVDSYCSILAGVMLLEQIQSATNETIKARKRNIATSYINQSLANALAMESIVQNADFLELNDKELMFAID